MVAKRVDEIAENILKLRSLINRIEIEVEEKSHLIIKR